MYETIHSMEKIKKVGMVLKLDINKAFDRVSWLFLDKLMEKLGFNAYLRKIISTCIYSSIFSVIVNGTLVIFFPSSRGIHQGDPISSILFIIMVYSLIHTITRAISLGFLNGFKPTFLEITVFH